MTEAEMPVAKIKGQTDSPTARQIQQVAQLGKVIGQVPSGLATGELWLGIAQHEPGV